MDTKKVLLVKYGEISLRKGNRGHAERELVELIKKRLEGFKNTRVKREQGRLLIENETGDLETNEVLYRIKHIFGIIGFCQAIKTKERDIVKLRKIAADFFMPHIKSNETFKVVTKRGDKKYPLTSNELSKEIGEEIFNLGVPVDLNNPDATLFVEVRTNVYFYLENIPGERGLPYGSSGKGVALLSGGFDSPVACFLAARRGVEVFPIYFHSPPFVGEKTLTKVHSIAEQLSRYTGKVNLLVVPFTETQLFMKENVQEEKLTLLTKRAMLRFASKYASCVNGSTLITGDSVGQVASQTIASLQAMNSATSLCILRPCAVMEKQEIIDVAKKIGTESISKLPYDDCCTLFVAKHPEIRPKTHIIERIEAALLPRLEPLMEKALREAVVTTF